MRELNISGRDIIKLAVTSIVIACAWVIVVYVITQLATGQASAYGGISLGGPVLLVFLALVSFTAAYAGYRRGSRSFTPASSETEEIA